MIPSYTKFLQDLSLPRGTGSDGVLAKLLVSLKILSRCGIRKAKEMGLWSGVWSSLPPSLPQPQVDAPHKLLWDWKATLRDLGMENVGRPGQASSVPGRLFAMPWSGSSRRESVAKKWGHSREGSGE